MGFDTGDHAGFHTGVCEMDKDFVHHKSSESSESQFRTQHIPIDLGTYANIHSLKIFVDLRKYDPGE